MSYHEVVWPDGTAYLVWAESNHEAYGLAAARRFPDDVPSISTTTNLDDDDYDEVIEFTRTPLGGTK